MGIEYAGQISTHPLVGALFKDMVVIEMLKYRFNRGKQSNLFHSYSTNGAERRRRCENGHDGLLLRDDCLLLVM